MFGTISTTKIENRIVDAQKRGDASAVENYVSILLNQKGVDTPNSNSIQEIARLYTNGFNIVPTGAPTQYTDEDGDTVKFTAREAKIAKTVYNVSNKAIDTLVKSELYKSADDHTKAAAVSYIYNTYRRLAVDTALDIDSKNKNVLFAEAIDIEKLAIIYAIAQTIKADKSVSGSRKAKITEYVSKQKLTAAQKYMVMGFLGYKNANGKTQVETYIKKLSNLSKSEKETLLEYSGYVA